MKYSIFIIIIASTVVDANAFGIIKNLKCGLAKLTGSKVTQNPTAQTERSITGISRDENWYQDYETRTLGDIKYVDTKKTNHITASSASAESKVIQLDVTPFLNKPRVKMEQKLKSAQPTKKPRPLNSDYSGNIFEVELRDGTVAIWKPESSSSLNNYRAEALAFQIDRFFGFNLIPPTVTKIIKGQRGSLQYRRKNVGDSTTRLRKMNEDELDKQRFMDFLIDNRDRHPGNTLVSHEGNIISIDHGLSFTGRGRRPVHLMEDTEERIVRYLTTDDGQRVMRKMDKAYRNEDFKRELRENLGAEDANRMLMRMEALINYSDRLFSN